MKANTCFLPTSVVTAFHIMIFRHDKFPTSTNFDFNFLLGDPRRIPRAQSAFEEPPKRPKGITVKVLNFYP